MIIDINEQIQCVRREITLRMRAYPKWVRAGRMKEIEADYQLRAMRAVLATLEAVAKDGDFKLT